jgi:MerR family transcriptional regulator/heat shock protein HspR
MLDEARPLYTIGTAAELLGVHPRTLRLYEDGGLLRPARKNNRRFYTANDLTWIQCIRYLIHEQGLNQEGLRRILARIPCQDIRHCPPEASAACPAAASRTTPCWDFARKDGEDGRLCYACQVYLSARDYVLEKWEIEAALGR